MMTFAKKTILLLLAGIYLLGCEGAVITMASSWYSTAAETAVDSSKNGPAKTLPHLSLPQRRMYLPLAGIFTFVSHTLTSTTDYGNDLVWLYQVWNSTASLLSETFLLYASDPSPPFFNA